MSLFESASLVVTPNGTKASKLYAIKPTDGSGDLTVTRATTATRVNSAGLIESVAVNVPRLDYTNSTCPSILVEPQRTNLQTYSEDFTNLVWGANLNASASANLAISPDGTMSADKIIENTSNSTHYIGQTQAGLISTSYTISVFAKAAERNFLFLFEDSAGGRNAYFDLTNGVVGNVGASATAKIENFGNGWYKCSVTYVSSGLLIRYRIGTALSNGVNSYLGNGTSGLFIWGAQIEEGSYATSYIPTTSASVTRNADAISKTGISSLIGQTEGTIYAEVLYNSTTPSISGGLDQPIISISNGMNNMINILLQGSTDNRVISYCLNGGSLQAILFSAVQSTGTIKAAVSYRSNYFALFVNGVKVGEDTSITIPALNTLTIGNYTTPNIGFIENLKASAIFKTALTDTECLQLTTI